MTHDSQQSGAVGFDYGFYSDCRDECVTRFGTLTDLPVIANPYERISQIHEGGPVLDVGAGRSRVLRSYMQLSDDLYTCVDSDPLGTFDYASVREIPQDRRFELAVANQLFEHLSVREAMDLAPEIAARLVRGAVLVATVPNVHHPVRQRSDVTHRTYWDYKALYTLCRHAGLEVTEIARYGKRQPESRLERLLAALMNRVYGIDWCDSILIVGKK